MEYALNCIVVGTTESQVHILHFAQVLVQFVIMEGDAWLEMRALLTNELSKTDDNIYKADIMRSIIATSGINMASQQG